MTHCRTFLLFLLLWSQLFGLKFYIDPVLGYRKIAAIRVSFQEDDSQGTTGNGLFLLEPDTTNCGSYTIDRPPHNNSYFTAQLRAVDSYFWNVSNGQFGIDLDNSVVFPEGDTESYQLAHTMDYYHSYGESEEVYEQKLVELFREALTVADLIDGIVFTNFDHIVVFHAGVGQELNWPFLDPTPEDIPSTYIDQTMLGDPIFGVEHGIILPETQNHLIFEEAKDIFTDPSESCDYQFGLTGTFALMIGFAEGLPPLWNVQNGESRIGVFGLMDQGSNNGRGVIPSPPDPWTRIQAGWTIPSIVTPTSEVLLPARFIKDSVVMVQIDDDEYFLIEHRNNYYINNVSIDNLRLSMYENSNDWPDLTTILFDYIFESSDFVNGVIKPSTDFNYDIGLTGSFSMPWYQSGLLIWHIDESVIEQGVDDYSINEDKQFQGVDLEESDGAQDIGYPSNFLFADPSIGYFGDMWFNGNLEYESINGKGFPEFGPSTYPNTKSNDGASTFLNIANISAPGDTMSFTVSNTMLAESFPDTIAFIRTVFDLDDDGINEVFGGENSLWWAHCNSLEIRHILLDTLESNNVFMGFDRQDDTTYIEIFEYDLDSTRKSQLYYILNDEIIIDSSNEYLDSTYYTVYDTSGMSELLSINEWSIHKKRVYGSSFEYGINESNYGIFRTSPEGNETKWTEKTFDYIAGIDIDEDASLDVLALSSDGFLFCFNSDLILMAGFPLDVKLQPPVLSRDLIDDSRPEIVVKSADSTSLFIFDHQGKIQFQIASMKDDELVALENINGQNSILTRSSIYQLGDATETLGNEWAFEHGDWGRSRTVTLNYSVDFSNENILSRAYCYPNPIRENKGTIRVESVNAEKIEIKLYDLAGYYKDTFSKNITTSDNQISEWIWDVSDVESGVYFAHIDVSKSSKTETHIIKIAVIH